MIDYVIRDREAWGRTKRLEIGEEIDSDHQLVTIWLEEKREKGRKKSIKGEKKERGSRLIRGSRKGF